MGGQGKEWKLGLVPAVGVSMLALGVLCLGAVNVSTRSSSYWKRDGLQYAVLEGFLLFDVLVVALAAFAYVSVGSRVPRPPQLHLHGLVLVMTLIYNGSYMVSEILYFHGTESLGLVAAAAQFLFYGVCKAGLFLLIRKRMKALGPPVSCCVQAHSWGLAAVASILATAIAGALVYAWGAFLLLRGVPVEEFDLILDLRVEEANVTVADKAAVLCLICVATLGMVVSFISAFGMMYSAWCLTRRAIFNLSERQVSAEELSKVESSLRRHLWGVVAAFSSTQLTILFQLLGGLGLLGEAKWGTQTASASIDGVGDVIGILLLSGIGVLLIREDPMAGDVGAEIRGLLFSAVVTGRAEMTFEGRVDAGSKFCVVSFPGKYLEDWNALTWACDQGDMSSACVFLPKADPKDRFARHVEPPETPGRCWCCSLYGSVKPWGCMWFQCWKENVDRAVSMGLPLVAVFFPHQAGKGIVRWEDLGTVDLWNGVGLGGSQKSEVAYLIHRDLHVIQEDLQALRRRVGRRSPPGKGPGQSEPTGKA